MQLLKRVSGGFSPKGLGVFTTDASGAGTVAIEATGTGVNEWEIEIKQGDNKVGTISLGNRELAAKVYNVTRYWTGSEFIKAEPKEIPLTMQALTAGTIEVDTPRSGMQYSLNGGEKTEMTETTTIDVKAGDKVQLYGKGTSITSYCKSSSGDYTSIAGGTAQVKVYGNIMSLVDETAYATNTTLTAEDTFRSLFKWNIHLTDASGLLLPAPTLTKRCYAEMFYKCTSLTTAPVLPAETLADYCYASMFEGCTSLTAAPALPAMTLTNYCYYKMFSGCTSLTTAPALPAPTLAVSCYKKMFYNCTNLNSVTCLATDISADYGTTDWLSGVAATGTFTKAATMNNWTEGISGIPSGWTINDAQ